MSGTDTAPTSSPRRKRSMSSMATSDGADFDDSRLKRAPIAKIRCDGNQPSCSNCTKHRKIGCTYVRVTPEENLQAKAKKRAAREHKAKYAALGLDPPPTMNTGRRRWEYTIRFQQQKLHGRNGSGSGGGSNAAEQEGEAGPSSAELAEYSPEGFSTSSWRIGDVVRQAAAHPANTVTPAEQRREYYSEQAQQQDPPCWAGSPLQKHAGSPQWPPPPVPGPLPYSAPPVMRPSGPVLAYTPYPLTPPMDEQQSDKGSPAANGSVGATAPAAAGGLGLYASERSWMLRPTVSGTGPVPVASGSQFSSWQSQRTVTIQRAPKAVVHVPVKPAPLPFIPPRQQVAVPYPSPHGPTHHFPMGLPAPVSVQPPPVPLYAPNPTRPARTCSFIKQVGSPPLPPLSEYDSPQARAAVKMEKADSEGPASTGMLVPVAPEWCLPPPLEPHSAAEQGPSLILSPPDHPQPILQGTAPRDSPAVSAASMMPSTSWTGSLYTPMMRSVASFHGDEWSSTYGPVGHQQHHHGAHLTPDMYSHAGW
ncbi:hypothetical protein JCM3774_004751 [Rhodotorula dairenensis]